MANGPTSVVTEGRVLVPSRYDFQNRKMLLVPSSLFFRGKKLWSHVIVVGISILISTVSILEFVGLCKNGWARIHLPTLQHDKFQEETT